MSARTAKIGRSCIGVKRQAGDDGKCNGARLHSWKYNGKKLYCTDCIAYQIQQYKLRDSRIVLGS